MTQAISKIIIFRKNEANQLQNNPDFSKTIQKFLMQTSLNQLYLEQFDTNQYRNILF